VESLTEKIVRDSCDSAKTLDRHIFAAFSTSMPSFRSIARLQANAAICISGHSSDKLLANRASRPDEYVLFMLLGHASFPTTTLVGRNSDRIRQPKDVSIFGDFLTES
jgi:hypothetical protein